MPRFSPDKFIVDVSTSFIQANIKSLKDVSTFVYVIPPRAEYRLDIISNDIYGTTELKWLLMYVNGIIDVSVLTFGYKLSYPSIQDVVSVLFQTADQS